MSQKLFDYDQSIRASKNAQIICGIDETGRGCWAGPLVAAAVIFEANTFIKGINDSKKLSDTKRMLLDDEIKNKCLSYGIAEVDVDIIDKKGITFANSHAMISAAKSAASKMGIDLSEIDLFIIDQSPCKSLVPHIMMPKADSTSAVVAAASILAKNHRDNLIKEFAIKHPEYKFDQHNGYINPIHVEAVNQHGLLEGIHRKSFTVSGFNKPKQINLMDFIDENSDN
jgi:ribonuclease HII